MPGTMTPPKVDRLPEHLWTVDNVADFLRCSSKTVYRYINEEGLPFIPLAGKYLFDPEEVYDWVLKRQKIKGASHEV